ncbi:MAG: cyclic nucleotide-binding domain-containing protein, partial [Marinicella sp.]
MIEAKDLKEYYPFNKIDVKFYPLLLNEFEFFEKQQGDKLYEINRRAENTKYLTKGVVQITTDKGREKTLKSTSLSAKYPVGDANKSNTMDAVVTSKTMSGFQISSNLVDHLQVWNSVYTSAAHDSPLRGHNSYEWVVGLLKSRSVQMLPQGNIGELFNELETRQVSAGEEVISEGDPGDYCYIIAEGIAEVFQVVSEGEQKVAILDKGTLFGESALVSSEPRNASVRMQSDGLLMKLAGATFSKLLKAHVVRWITAQNALEMLAEGATLI